MYNIGFIRMEKATVQEGGNSKEVKWMEVYFMIPGFERFTAKLSKNNNKNGENSPDYYLYRRAKFNKNVSFRDYKIGTLWLKEKDVNGSKEKYMTGRMILGTQEVSIGVFKAKPLYEGEQVNYLYDVVLFPDNEKQNTYSDSNDNTYHETVEPPVQNNQYVNNETTLPTVEIDEEEIPF
jgi:hypothetical protein